MSTLGIKSKLLNVCGLPTDEHIENSVKCFHDRFFKLPNYIECFISRLHQELPKNYRVMPWTINRAVSVFKNNKIFLVIDYDDIEADIVSWLDLVVHQAQKSYKEDIHASI